jgi:hypothetical protein
LAYFVEIMARVFVGLRDEAQRRAGKEPVAEPPEPIRLDPRARMVLGLFARQQRITSRDAARVLGLSERMARLLIKAWVKDGWIEILDPARRSRAYGLSAIHRQSIGNPAG